jgi:excisionase family DNA binding protein
MPKTYASVEDEMRRLRICERTFRKLVRLGLIPSYRPSGRRILLVPEEVDAALEARFRREAPQPA